MISPEEIQKIATLMRIDLKDLEEHIERVQKSIEFFNMLDEVDLKSEDIISQQVTLDKLRKDEYIQYDKKLIEELKNYKGTYVRAPKMK